MKPLDAPRKPMLKKIMSGERRRACLMMLLVFSAFLQESLSAFELRITAKELNASLAPEYNRAFYNCLTGGGGGRLAFNDALDLRLGLEGGALGMGQWYHTAALNAFFTARYKLPLNLPLGIVLSPGVSYLFNGLFGYETLSHTLLPFIEAGTGRAGAAFGIITRWNSFYGETMPEPELVIAYRVYVNFINNRKATIGLVCANFDDFAAENFGSYFLSFIGVLRLREHLSLTNELRLRQSGGRAYTNNFYGIAYRGGVTWAF